MARRKFGLVRAPKPEAFESASSWLTRLALSQGAELKELLRVFDFRGHKDVDREAIGARLQKIRDWCGLGSDDLVNAERVMVGLASTGCSKYMARVGRQPRFRYCPTCLSEMSAPHFPIHWRFIAWRWCPLHDCLLEDHCPHCKCPVVLPADLFLAGPEKAGIPTLDLCLNCGRKLTDAKPYVIADGHPQVISEWDKRQLENGRALLAAMYLGSFRLKGAADVFGIHELYRIRAIEGPASDFEWLTPDKIRQKEARISEIRTRQQNTDLVAQLSELALAYSIISKV